MLKKMQEKAGFISIEVIIVAGLIVALGAYAISEFYTVGNMQTDRAINRVNQVISISAGE